MNPPHTGRQVPIAVAVAKTTSTPPAAMPVLTTRLWALLVFLGLVWGGSFFLTQIALPHVPPLPLVAIRVGLAALVLVAYSRLRGLSLRPLRERAAAFLLLGLLNNAIPFLLLAVGQTKLGGGLASILNATTPLWTILAAALLTQDEGLTGQKLLGIAFGIGGVAVLVGPGALVAGGAPAWAFAAILGATLSYALAAIHAKRLKGVAPSTVACGQLVASSALMIPLALLTNDVASLSIPPYALAAIATLAVLSTAIAYILYFEIVAKAGAINASLVTFLVPPSAILLGVLFLGERLAIAEILGFALILAGLAAVDGRLARSLHKARSRA